MLKFKDLKPGTWLVSPWGEVVLVHEYPFATMKKWVSIGWGNDPNNYRWYKKDEAEHIFGGWEILGRE